MEPIEFSWFIHTFRGILSGLQTGLALFFLFGIFLPVVFGGYSIVP